MSPMVRAVLAVAAITLGACTDVREFDGRWSGPRVGDAPALQVGVAHDATAALTVARVDRYGLTGTLDVTGLCVGAAVAPLAGAEADRLASLTFDGAPLRVYLATVATVDGGGDALAMIALFDDRRVEVRLIRGGARPVYAIFDLRA
ncbi:MAG: hypothetical protein IPH44_14960 [Myxococcales bacterium]|nr:hypothetical protein [Myxococcales bacterium]